MKKLIVFVTILVGFFGMANVTKAATWKDDNNQPIKAGNCTLVDKKSEADASHVYTLNPDNAKQIGYAYFNYWGREARCDEIQFHVDHNTSIPRLQKWLSDIAIGWYKNIGTTHFKGRTVSTSRYEWFYIDANGIHRIPDWLTASSWGLLTTDRISISDGLTEAFYKYAKLGSPLQFNEGAYASLMLTMWKSGNTSALDSWVGGNIQATPAIPIRLADEIRWADTSRSVFTSCDYNSSHGDPREVLLNWRWMKYNVGCPLAQ